ncbi:hypothetical protein [Malacoplasma muris]|uniref:hypothetical protein n=1 Tax=Malacoplasma muris TaxID=2119 RepID=UPI00398E3C10
MSNNNNILNVSIRSGNPFVDTNGQLNVIGIVLIFCAFFISIVIASIIKKIYYRFWLKKKYFVIPRPSIKGIASISMTIALSVAVLILMTIITSNLFSVLFRAFPGTRVTIEGILIKIGGLLFGPFLGLFIGMLTDLLSVLMTAGIFHYGYFVAAIGYGLIAGLIRTFVTFSSKNKLRFAIYSTIALLLTGIITFYYFYTQTPETGLQIKFGADILIPKMTMIVILVSFSGITIIILWTFYFLNLRWVRNSIEKRKYFSNTNPNRKKKKQTSDKFIAFCATITCVVITEMFVNVFAMPHFDAEVTSLGPTEWLAIRSVLFIPMVFLNMFIIYPVYTIVTPLVTYDYEKELSEALHIKLQED